MRKHGWMALLWTVVAVNSVSQAEDLTCLKQDGAKKVSLFYESLQKEAYAALDVRMQGFEKLKSPEQIQEHQKKLREFFIARLGGFPDRTDLHSQTVGKIEADGYVIEKVIFESQPKHHVTANLYLPKLPPPYPAAIVSSGHSRTAKTAEYNQRFGIALARHGIAALCYDPIGQGERSQILNADGSPQFSGTTQEHFLVGVGSILVGTNTARYRVWDAMRAIDYLASRTDIDSSKIGMTGCSGGGTLTSYVMALDDRVACAAPACYLTTFRRLIETIGPQDAEQNIFGQLAFGLDHPDYILMRAPKPTLISSTTGDYFSIEGSWENYRQAKRIYTRFGFPDRVDLVEAEGTHGVHPANLAAISKWMRRWLVGKDDSVDLSSFDIKPEKELLCTERGQVLLLPDERSVFDLNSELEKKLAADRRSAWERKSPQERVQTVRQIAGIRPRKDLPVAKWEKAGRVHRERYHIDKVVLRADSNVPIPALTFHPKEPQESAYLYLHTDGKLADAAPGGPIEKLVDEGYVVVAIDLRGQGETSDGGASKKPDAVLGDWKPFYLAYLLGKSVVGMHAEDCITAGHWVAHYQAEKPRQVHLVAVGGAAISALHAAALEPDLFTTVTLRDAPEDWASIVPQSAPVRQLINTVHGVLRHYDLPDLAKMLRPDQMRVETSGTSERP